MDFYNRIATWNEKRNGLVFDLSLEKKMLTEEVIEFLQSDNLPNRIKELCDIGFVLTGTQAKVNAARPLKPSVRADLDEFMLWLNDSIDYFTTLLGKELAEVLKPETEIEEFLNQCMDYVIKANEAKGTEKDENGKVKKGPNYKKPEPLIAALIEENAR